MQDIQADVAIVVHVAMIDLCVKLNLRRLEGIVRWEVDIEREAPILIRRASLSIRAGLRWRDLI